MAVAATVLAGVGLTASSAALAASGASAPRWRIAGTTTGYLFSLVAPSSGTQWAFGADELNKPMPPVALRHVASRWVQAAMPAAAKGAITCAGASSPSNIWAFESVAYGPFGANTTAALELRSGHWVMRHNFGGFFLTDCLVLSPTDVWAFGSTGAGPAIGTWHLHGRTWTHITSPVDSLGQASAVSPSNIWATGWDGIEGVLAHWNGSTWKADASILKALPRPSSTVEVQVAAVKAISSTNLWVVAHVNRQDKHGAWHPTRQVEHWNGARWSRVAASAFGYYLPVADADGHGSWWSAGYGPANWLTSMTYLLHGSHGRWVKVPLPTVRRGYVLKVFDIVSVPDTRTSYAIGDEINKATGYGSGVMLKITY